MTPLLTDADVAALLVVSRKTVQRMAERKRLYLLKHPETKRGAQGGGRDGVGTRQRTETEIISFTADAAEKIGVTDRSIRQDVQIAESIPEDVRDALRETPLADSKTDLLDMARLPEEIQREVIATADLTSKESVRQAVAAHKPTKPAPQSPQPEPEPQEEQEAHTTEVIATVEAFAVAIAALFSVNERRRLMRLIADDIKQEAALSGN